LDDAPIVTYCFCLAIPMLLDVVERRALLSKCKGVESRGPSIILYIASKREVSDIDGDGVHGQEE